MFKFDDIQSFGKDAYEANIAAATAMAKGFQTVAKEVAEYNRSAFEKGTKALEQVSQLKSLEQVATAQQSFTKDSYENFVSEATRIGNIYSEAVKEAYRPLEANMKSFGVTLPK
jgi:hypothetical protein